MCKCLEERYFYYKFVVYDNWYFLIYIVLDFIFHSIKTKFNFSRVRFKLEALSVTTRLTTVAIQICIVWQTIGLDLWCKTRFQQSVLLMEETGGPEDRVHTLFCWAKSRTFQGLSRTKISFQAPFSEHFHI